MKKNQMHPAGIRSRKLISESLLNLMTSQNYEKISVTDIAEEAQLTRRTFYAHFATKEDVLNYHLDQLSRHLLREIGELDYYNHRIITLMYFRFWINHVQLLELLKDRHLLFVLYENFEKQLGDLKQLFICSNSYNDSKYDDYSSAYFIGILSGIMETWIENGFVETPEELVELIIGITNNLSNHFTNDK